MITALVPTYNACRTVRRCLESLKWVDKIYVVDSFSTDGTLDICREYTQWVDQHEYINSASQKNWAMSHIETEWVLQIDSDEELAPELADEIKAALAQADSPADGYLIPRRNLVWGEWIRKAGFYPDFQLRLFRSRSGRWVDREVHSRIVGPKSIRTLRNHLIHHDVFDLSLELTQFSSQIIKWEMSELVKQKHSCHWYDVVLRPAAIFILLYVLRGGFLQGFRGFFASAFRAYYSFFVYARLFESEIRRGIRE